RSAADAARHQPDGDVITTPVQLSVSQGDPVTTHRSLQRMGLRPPTECLVRWLVRGEPIGESIIRLRRRCLIRYVDGAQRQRGITDDLLQHLAKNRNEA